MKKIMPSDGGTQPREDLENAPGDNSPAGAEGTRKEQAEAHHY